jgi:hypothetical protein
MAAHTFRRVGANLLYCCRAVCDAYQLISTFSAEVALFSHIYFPCDVTGLLLLQDFQMLSGRLVMLFSISEGAVASGNEALDFSNQTRDGRPSAACNAFGGHDTPPLR